jgi:hypothetical protein
MFKSLLIAVITISSLCISNVSIAGDGMSWLQAQELQDLQEEQNKLLKEQIEQNRRIEEQLEDIKRQQRRLR